jgi:AraC-like DNA-binding protein
MDYISFCRNYFAATNIPVSLLKSEKPVYSSLGEMLSKPTPLSHWKLFPLERNPVFCALSPDLEYGRVHVEGTDYDVILGPAFSVPLTEQLVRQCMREFMLTSDYREQLTEYLACIPQTSQLQFAKHLAFLYQCLNNKEVNLHDFFIENEIKTIDRSQRQLDRSIDDAETDMLHNTYHFELEIYQYIKEGNVQRLKDFLNSNIKPLKEGKLAHTPVRHAKNIFIATAVKAGFLGAIPGGVDVEKTYQLVDFYIQECEQLQTIEEITNLQYMMVLDFCQRAGETQIPEGISSEVYQCVNYIRSHTNESINIDDVASQVHRSSSYMMRRFREELGIHIGTFITRCKLEEAKTLLTYSDKSLADISNYFCFSSQSYFQNVFKKQYGITPMQYRKNTQKK